MPEIVWVAWLVRVGIPVIVGTIGAIVSITNKLLAVNLFEFRALSVSVTSIL